MGYAGGSSDNPTYARLGDHSETVQIDYDPDKISYQELLEAFWDSHYATVQPWSRQYMSIVFYHNEEQRELAVAGKQQEEIESGRKIATEIIPFSAFYLAEDYHQKYYLRHESDLMKELSAIYPVFEDFISSTSVARVNGYAGGYGTQDALGEELNSLGLSEAGRNKILDIADRGLVAGCAVG